MYIAVLRVHRSVQVYQCVYVYLKKTLAQAAQHCIVSVVVAVCTVAAVCHLLLQLQGMGRVVSARVNYVKIPCSHCCVLWHHDLVRVLP